MIIQAQTLIYGTVIWITYFTNSKIMTPLKSRISWAIECDFAKSSVNNTFHDTSSDKLLQDITLTLIEICEN
jgi:hypothetical protein